MKKPLLVLGGLGAILLLAGKGHAAPKITKANVQQLVADTLASGDRRRISDLAKALYAQGFPAQAAQLEYELSVGKGTVSPKAPGR